MRDDPPSRSVTFIFVSIGILAVTVAGVLVSDFYSRLTGSADAQLATTFDPDRYPSPAAGVAETNTTARDCNGIIYRTTNDGTRYVRQSGGGVLIGAEYDKKFGFYRIEYGVLTAVDITTVDLFVREKLKYALYNCTGPFTPSGINF